MSASGLEYLFLTCASLVKVGEQTTSFGASARLGSIAPARALGRLGYDARAYSATGDIAAVEEATRSARCVVFGEMWEMKDGWAGPAAIYRRLLAQLDDPGSRAVFSIADDHFDDPHFLGFYREALPHCLAVTVASETLATTVRSLTGRPVLVAPEPVEGLRGVPQAIAARRLPRPVAWLARRVGLSMDHWRVRLLWFGYLQNLPPLLELVPALEKYAARYPLLLTCVTRPVAEIEALMTPARTSEQSRFRVHFIPWSPVVMDAVVEQSDVVLIPSDYRNPVKQAKSPNRLVTGLHGGRFVVAHPLRAYAPYAGFAWIGEDLVEGLDWAIRHPREVVERVVRGQAFIDERHSADAVARFWLDVFDTKT
jgi:hypothetical protein